jgi:hypothetical protein
METSGERRRSGGCVRFETTASEGGDLAGETYEFEFHPEAKGELRLESTIFGKFRMVMLVEVE